MERYFHFVFYSVERYEEKESNGFDESIHESFREEAKEESNGQYNCNDQEEIEDQESIHDFDN